MNWTTRMLAAALVAAPLAPVAAQQRIDRPGPVAHRAADATFAERVGEFRRINVTQYDPQGQDISAGYDLVRPDGRVTLTIYIYPASRLAEAAGAGDSRATDRATLCSREFDGVRQAITSRFRDAERVADGSAPAMAGVAPALSLRSVYSFVTEYDGKAQPVRSEADLYCFVRDRWLVKYRVTGPVGIDAEEAVVAFIRNGPWPGRTAPLDPDEITAIAGRASPTG